MGSLKKKCVCPTCLVPVQVKGLHKNLTFSTLLSCAGKLKDILEGQSLQQKTKAILESPLEEDADMTQLDDLSALASVKPFEPILENIEEAEKVEEKENIVEEARNENVEPPPKKSNSKRTTPVSKSKTSTTRMKTPTTGDKAKKTASPAKSPETPSTKEPLKILMSGLKADDKNLVSEYFKDVQKGVKVQLANDYDPKTVNRIIMNVDDNGFCTRTTKYLRGVLDGKVIVSFTWFLDSLAQKEWLPFEAYLVKGDTSINMITNSVEKSLAAKDSDRLFTGYTFYLCGKFGSPSKADLTALLKAGGAKVLGIRPKDELPDNHVLVYDPDLLDDASLWIAEYKQRTSSLWVLDCISSYEVLPLY